MEGLIIIIAELLLLHFIAGMAALCELVLSLASLMLQLVFGISPKRSKEPKENQINISPAPIKWIRKNQRPTFSKTPLIPFLIC
ncbi:hypothetical protein VDG1235_3230 [Verrucomicrobiia bacterium DG1235]|nr:hypothetical protein VDG1235_3230 [Verrucomicrobiae bacterium DG1235]